jgi:hypothetical protein
MPFWFHDEMRVSTFKTWCCGGQSRRMWRPLLTDALRWQASHRDKGRGQSADCLSRVSIQVTEHFTTGGNGPTDFGFANSNTKGSTNQDDEETAVGHKLKTMVIHRRSPVVFLLLLLPLLAVSTVRATEHFRGDNDDAIMMACMDARFWFNDSSCSSGDPDVEGTLTMPVYPTDDSCGTCVLLGPLSRSSRVLAFCRPISSIVNKLMKKSAA